MIDQSNYLLFANFWSSCLIILFSSIDIFKMTQMGHASLDACVSLSCIWDYALLEAYLDSLKSCLY